MHLLVAARGVPTYLGLPLCLELIKENIEMFFFFFILFSIFVSSQQHRNWELPVNEKQSKPVFSSRLLINVL